MMKEMYTRRLAQAAKGKPGAVYDVAYGEHARHRLDLFRKEGADKAPIVVFMHGGAFVRGDKNISAEIYSNVTAWFATQGFLAVNLEYRLAPEAKFPEPVHDLARAIQWLRTHAPEYGGDPGQIFLVGHSAGGTHVASYLYDPGVGYLAEHIRGGVLMSARLRADVDPINPNAKGVAAYFGDDDPGLLEQCSPVTYAEISRVPTMVVIAQYENPLLDVYGLEMAYRLSKGRRQAMRFVQAPLHNHISLVAHFNTEEVSVGADIVEFIRGCLME